MIERLKMSPDEMKRQYHVMLLKDAGLMAHVGGSKYRLTAAGHDYLDAIRDEGIWKKTKAAIAKDGGSATMDIIMTLATGFLKKQISQRTGIDL